MESDLDIAQPVRAAIDLEALEGNLRHVERLIRSGEGPGQHVIASVKANAYGHGVVEVGRALERFGVHSLATGSVVEARALRAAGVALPVLVFGATPPEGAAAIAAEGFVPTVTSLATAEAVARGGRGAERPVYVKVDAGLGRLGVLLEEAPEALDRIAALEGVRIEGVYTHVPFADRRGLEWARERLAAFDTFLREVERRGHAVPITQARASSCVLAGLSDSCNAVCVGHALFGLSPYRADDLADLEGLRPVLARLSTRLIHVGRRGQGSDAAIGGLYGIERSKTLGVLPVGLGHGFGRPAPGKQAWVLIGGRRAKVLAVSLEHTTVDLDGCEDAEPGAEVTLLGADGGDAIPLAEMAGWLGETPLETAMRLSGRAEIETVDAVREVWSTFGSRAGRGQGEGERPCS